MNQISCYAIVSKELSISSPHIRTQNSDFLKPLEFSALCKGANTTEYLTVLNGVGGA